MMRIVLIVVMFLISNVCSSQVGIGTTTPDNNAVLDLVSSNEGVLISRISLTSVSNSSPLSNHVSGMIVYNTTNSGTGNEIVFPGFYYNNGQQWIRLETFANELGDVKHGIMLGDHNGWYLLNGRNVNTLPVKAKSNAIALGFTSNLPNANDSFLKGKAGLETIGTSGGSNNRILVQENLPNVMFSGTTNSTGAHSHNYEDKYHGSTENLNIVTGLLGILSGVVLNIMNNDVGSPVVSNDIGISSLAGSHNHTVTINTGGSSAPLPLPAHLVVNTFVYLGK